MLTVIQNLPVHVFGVRASGEVTKDDLKNMLLPGLESDVQNFTAGAWIQDLIAVEKFTDIFSYVSPGEAKGFKLNDLQTAIDWLNIKS